MTLTNGTQKQKWQHKMKIAIIAAVSIDDVIGQGEELPWENLETFKEAKREDLQRFKELTSGRPVIMGRKTYESIIKRNGKPLPNRTNIVLTSNTNYEVAKEVRVENSLPGAISLAQAFDDKEIYIIGGAQVYKKAMGLATHLYITRMQSTFPTGDTFFPQISEKDWVKKSSEKRSEKHSFIIYERKQS